MAVADRSIDPRILESARTEFLASGFEKASLKTICEGAGVTTGALYKRYKGKEELSVRWWNRRFRTCTKWPMPGGIRTHGHVQPGTDQGVGHGWGGHDMVVPFPLRPAGRLLSAPLLLPGDPVRQLPPRLGGASDEGHQRLSGGGPAAWPVPERCRAGGATHPAVRFLDHDL